jgi:hypothetical protein
VPPQPADINNSPVNIIFSSDHLVDIKNLANLESKTILPEPNKMQEIQETSQENVVSNEIQKLLPAEVEDPREELHTINDAIKQHSEQLHEQVLEEDIHLKGVEHFQQDLDLIGD